MSPLICCKVPKISTTRNSAFDVMPTRLQACNLHRLRFVLYTLLMPQLRILARTLVIDSSNKILLVRNRDADFWYPPGGGWEYTHETITECATREVKEETGYDVTIDRLLWLQEFHVEGKIFFETFWLSHLSQSSEQISNPPDRHADLDPEGLVEEASWYTQSELANLKVFPERIKLYQDFIEKQTAIDNPFIGTFK